MKTNNNKIHMVALIAIFTTSFTISSLTGCKKEENTVEVNNTEVPATPVPVSTPPVVNSTEITKEEIKPVPSTPTPKKVELAPENIFFLKVKKSVETDSGIVGFPAGTKVTKISDSKYKTDSGETLELVPIDITNNLDEVRSIIGQDRLNQALIKQKNSIVPNTPVPETPSTPVPAPQVNTNNPPVSSLSGPTERRKDGYLWKKDAAGNWVKFKKLSDL